MCSLLKVDLLNAISAWRERQHCQPEEMRLRILFDGGSLAFRFERRDFLGGPAAASARASHPMTQPSAPKPPDLTHNALWLSPNETKIVEALAKAGDWTSSQKIADAAGLDCNESFKAVCGNLVDRQILESAPGRGYRLARRADQG